jgi:hypothetical protein
MQPNNPSPKGGLDRGILLYWYQSINRNSQIDVIWKFSIFLCDSNTEEPELYGAS